MLQELNYREHQCLVYACLDKNIAETAKIMCLATETIRTHRKNILKKLNCQTIAGAIAMALAKKELSLPLIFTPRGDDSLVFKRYSNCVR